MIIDFLNSQKSLILKFLFLYSFLTITACSLTFAKIGKKMGTENDEYIFKNRNKCSYYEHEILNDKPIYENIQHNTGKNVGFVFDTIISFTIILVPPQNLIKYFAGVFYFYSANYISSTSKNLKEIIPPPKLQDGWLYKDFKECNSNSLVLFKLEQEISKNDANDLCIVNEDRRSYFTNTFFNLNNLENINAEKLNSELNKVNIQTSETKDKCKFVYLFTYKGGISQLKNDFAL